MKSLAVAVVAFAGASSAFAQGATLPLRAERVAVSSITMSAEKTSRRELLQTGAVLAGLFAASPALAAEGSANVFSGKQATLSFLMSSPCR